MLALAKSCRTEAVTPLIDALRDSAAQVRKEAAQLLGTLHDPRVAQPLIDALPDSDVSVRKVIAIALGKAGDVKAIEPLLAMAFSDGTVQSRAVKALKHLGWNPAEGEQLALTTVANAAEKCQSEWSEEDFCKAVVKHRTSSIRPLIAQCTNENARVRSFAVTALGKIGDSLAVDSLLKALKDPDLRVQRNAAGALATIRDSRAVDPLINSLRRAGHANAAAAALAEFGDTRAIIPLIGSSKAKNGCSRAVASGAICEICRRKNSIDLLLNALKDCDQDDRAWLVELMGQIGNAAAIEPLLSLGLSDRTVRTATIKSLTTLRLKTKWNPTPEENALFDVMNAAEQAGYSGPTKEYWREVATHSAAAVAPLIVLLQNENELDIVRGEVAEALARTSDPRSLQPLLSALNDRIPYVRMAAATALGRLCNPQSVEPLIEALGDNSVGVRLRVLEALGCLRDLRVIEPLISALKDNDRAIRLFAVSALEKTRDVRATEPLLKLLNDPDSGVRSAAVSAVEKLGGTKAVAPLTLLLGDRDIEAEVLNKVVSALGRIGDESSIVPLATRQRRLEEFIAKEIETAKNHRSHDSSPASDRAERIRDRIAFAIDEIRRRLEG